MSSDPTALPFSAPPDEAAVRARLVWQVAPLSVAFFLDLVDLGRVRDVVDSILFGAIFVANLGPVNRDAYLAQAHATLDTILPDDLRRPVSINAVAQSLRLPFETVRRRVGRLAKEGAVVITPKGVYVPAEAFTTPEIVTAAIGRHVRLGRLYADLRAIGAIPDPDGPPQPAVDGPPVRVTNRAIADWMMRLIDRVVALVGEPVAALILARLVHENIEGFDAAELAAWASDPVGKGRPVRTVRLAERLRFSPETTRRHVLRLEQAGYCVRAGDGLLATAPAEVRPAIVQLAEDNLADIQRLFGRLRQLGALAAWDEPPAASLAG